VDIGVEVPGNPAVKYSGIYENEPAVALGCLVVVAAAEAAGVSNVGADGLGVRKVPVLASL
jgi:hypothetical protein